MIDSYIAFDFETTGLDPRTDEVIEVGAVRFLVDGTVLDEFQSFAKPETPIPKESTAIHGISDADVDGAPSPREVWLEFLSWIGDSPRLIAHNAQFEIHFIRKMTQPGDPWSELTVADTLRMSRARIESTSYKLSDLVDSSATRAHRALADAKACMALFLKVSATYKSGKVPARTYWLPIGEYPAYNPDPPPTARQRSYIEHLGGKPQKPKTKAEAGEYIDELKRGSIASKKRGCRTPLLLLLLLMLVVLWLVSLLG